MPLPSLSSKERGVTACSLSVRLGSSEQRVQDRRLSQGIYRNPMPRAHARSGSPSTGRTQARFSLVRRQHWDYTANISPGFATTPEEKQLQVAQHP